MNAEQEVEYLIDLRGGCPDYYKCILANATEICLGDRHIYCGLYERRHPDGLPNFLPDFIGSRRRLKDD